MMDLWMKNRQQWTDKINKDLLAKAENHNKEIKELKDHYEKELEGNDRVAKKEALDKLANCYRLLGRYEEAEELYKKIFKRKKKYFTKKKKGKNAKSKSWILQPSSVVSRVTTIAEQPHFSARVTRLLTRSLDLLQ